MQTIGRAAKSVGLSRSTLLYYDRIGLLSPSGRSPAGYRFYSNADMRRLEKIVFFRRTGASLEEIAQMLEVSESKLGSMLERRLGELADQIQVLREQQQVIVDLLRLDALPSWIRGMNKKKWVALLRAVGLDDQRMWEWHVRFEEMTPGGHHDFLSALGIGEKEIAAIRNWATAGQFGEAP